MAEDKKTQMGTAPGRTARPTANQSSAIASAVGTPAPAHTPPPTHTPPPATDASRAKTSYLTDTPDPLLGATVAERYKIIRKLGEGGMGSVYLAMHTVLEKQVALKVLHGEFARKPDLVERFIQEAKAASRIRHENVIDISDFGVTPDGLVFFAMELLQGHDLHEEIARAKLAGNLLPWSRSKKIFLQICGALGAAHARGIIHRDLKPENVYLVEFLGDPDFVKLLDFGIAKLTDVSDDENGRKLTKTGMLFGTPEYMSPEQARGERVDHRVDIYAMGCILFQLCSNRVPFQAENFMGVLSQHLTEEPPQIAPETFDQIGAPRELTDVIDRALAKDRNVRWQTIEELANAVREVSGDPLNADKSQKLRAASVPSPGETTRARTPTGPAARPRTGETAPLQRRTPGETGRQKPEWTGSLKVPEEIAHEPAPQKRSMLPILVGAGVLVAAGVAVAVFLANKDSGQGTVATGSGSAGSAAAIVEPPPPPPPPVEPPLPDMVTIKFESTPKGATVIDSSTNETLGRTPHQFTIPGSKTPRRFTFKLKGYGDSTVELVPNRPEITYAQTLQKGATKPDVVTKVPDPTIKPAAGTGSAGVTKPSDVTVVKPADPTTKPADPATKPTDPTTKPADPTTKPADPTTKPADPKPDTKPADPDCPDDSEPCLKVNIPGMGSAKP